MGVVNVNILGHACYICENEPFTFMLTFLKNKINKFLAFFQRFGPLAPVIYCFVIALVLFFTFRVILNLLYWDRVTTEPRFLLMYPIGVRIDTIVISYFLFLPTTLFLLLPESINRYLKNFWTIYFTVFIFVIFFLEMATFAFMREYDLRPDSIFIRYLGNFKEVSATVWKANKWDLILALLLSGFVVWLAWKSFRKLVVGYRHMKWPYHFLLLPCLLALLFMGARSSFGPRPANISTAYFSERNKLVNELTLNSTFSIYMAIDMLSHEKNPSAFYGSMSEEEIFQRVRTNMLLPDSLFVQSEIPFLHKQPSLKTERPMNVVIILEESLGAEYVGFLKGLPLTPYLDSLSKKGLAFTNLYSTGTRTVRGIEATLSGFLPTPGSSVVNLGLSRRGFFTAGQLFGSAGYTTEFIYGGESNFDEMRSFFLGNGFDHVYDLPTFKDYVFKSTWGVSDEDLMTKADEVFRSHGDKPFFSVILSTSNHSPFEFPDGRIQLYEQPKNTVFNAMKYADYAIGKFFELAKRSPYYNNTLFLVVADHSTRVFGDDFIPVQKFHIPGVLIGPNVPTEAFTKVASQIDLLPTILNYAGIDVTTPMIGRNLMTMPAGDPGRCFMQYGMNYGYMTGDTVTILQPYLKPQAFIYDNRSFKLTAIPNADPEKNKDALAHALLPWKLYETQRYRLK